MVFHDDADALAPCLAGEVCRGIAARQKFGADMDVHVDDALAVDRGQGFAGGHGSILLSFLFLQAMRWS